MARYQKTESWLWGRSVCPECQYQLRPWQLVPILGWLWQFGRCRDCHKPISWRYPLFELLAALGSAGLVWRYGWQWSTLALGLAWLWFSAAIYIDWQEQVVPDRLIIPALGWLALAWLSGFQTGQLADLYLVLGLTALTALLSLGSGERLMGSGDIGLVLWLSLYFGWPLGLAAFALSFIIGTLLVLPRVWTKRLDLKQAVSFGPFLWLAVVAVELWRPSVLAYVNWLSFGSTLGGY